MKIPEREINKAGKRRVEITIEKHSQTIIRIRNGRTNFQFCRTCGCDTMAFAFADAALIFNLDVQFLEELFQNNQIHNAAENAVCGNSLAGFSKKEIRYIED